MPKVLITGATGNVGMEVIKSLQQFSHRLEIIAGVRDLEKDKASLAPYKIGLKKFDFTDITTYKPALESCDILFLLRPPQISEVQSYFKPLIEIAKHTGIQHIVFLSVQGVENSKIIPHHKIEKLIVESKIAYTFLRPAYFMQNFNTILRNDLVNKNLIFLPAGTAKFTLVDVRDIGAVAATILADTNLHMHQVYELTSKEKLSFKEMAETLSMVLGNNIRYESPNLLHFYLIKRKEQIPFALILVMIMLHYFPRFQKEPSLSNCIEEITGKPPFTFEQYIIVNKTLLV